MAGDLLFYILPRLGKVPFKPEARRVVAVSKDAIMKPLNEEDPHFLSVSKRAQARENEKDQEHHGIYRDEKGQKHFDDFA